MNTVSGFLGEFGSEIFLGEGHVVSGVFAHRQTVYRLCDLVASQHECHHQDLGVLSFGYLHTHTHVH